MEEKEELNSDPLIIYNNIVSLKSYAIETLIIYNTSFIEQIDKSDLPYDLIEFVKEYEYKHLYIDGRGIIFDSSCNLRKNVIKYIDKNNLSLASYYYYFSYRIINDNESKKVSNYGIHLGIYYDNPAMIEYFKNNYGIIDFDDKDVMKSIVNRGHLKSLRLIINLRNIKEIYDFCENHNMINQLKLCLNNNNDLIESLKKEYDNYFYKYHTNWDKPILKCNMKVLSLLNDEFKQYYEKIVEHERNLHRRYIEDVSLLESHPLVDKQ